MLSSKAHFSKCLLFIYKLKSFIYLINFALNTQFTNLVIIFLSFLLNFCYVKYDVNGFMLKIAINWNKIIKICKYKANNVMLSGPIMLNICQIYIIKNYDICINVKINFKVFKIKINILFGGH